jgi:hypothetical protein
VSLAAASGGETKMCAKTIEQVLRDHTGELMTLIGVVGTAQGLADHTPCIKVYVGKKTPELEQKVPSVLEGYPVVVEEIGQVEALDDLD